MRRKLYHSSGKKKLELQTYKTYNPLPFLFFYPVAGTSFHSYPHKNSCPQMQVSELSDLTFEFDSEQIQTDSTEQFIWELNLTKSYISKRLLNQVIDSTCMHSCFTFSWYWRREESSDWMRAVACPMKTAQQVAPTIMLSIVSQISERLSGA